MTEAKLSMLLDSIRASFIKEKHFLMGDDDWLSLKEDVENIRGTKLAHDEDTFDFMGSIVHRNYSPGTSGWILGNKATIGIMKRTLLRKKMRAAKNKKV